MEFGLLSLWIWICLFPCTFPWGTDMSDVGIISDSVEALVNFEKENSAFGSEWIIDQVSSYLENKLWDFAPVLKPTGSCKSQDNIRSGEETSLGSKMISRVNSLLTSLRNVTSADYIFTTSTNAITDDVIMTVDTLKVISDGVYKTVMTIGRSHILATVSSITALVMFLREISIEGNRQTFLAEMKNTSIRKKEEIREILANCKIVKYEKSKKTEQSKENASPKHPCINMRVTDIIPRFTVQYLEKVEKLRHYQMGAFILPNRLILGLAAMPLHTPVEVKEKAIMQQYTVYKQRKNRKWINDLRNLAVGMMPRDWIDSNIVAI